MKVYGFCSQKKGFVNTSAYFQDPSASLASLVSSSKETLPWLALFLACVQAGSTRAIPYSIWTDLSTFFTLRLSALVQQIEFTMRLKTRGIARSRQLPYQR